MIWAVVLACAPDGRIADRATYLEALRQPYAEAEVTCKRVLLPDLRGECLTEAASAAATARDVAAAQRICDSVDDPLWRDECTFLAADQLHLKGDDAVAWCNRTHGFRENCLGHAIGREVEDVEGRYGKAGLEGVLEQQLTETVARYKPGAPEDQRRATVDRILAQILSKRWEGAAFDASLCGKATEAMCALAYRMQLDGAPPEVDLAAACAAGATPAAVAAARAPGWAPGSEAVAAITWREFCADLTSGKVVRDGSKAMGVGPAPVPGALPGERVGGPPSAVGAQPPPLE